MTARRNVLNNSELVRRLQAVGEHQKANMLWRSTHGQAQRMQRGFRAAEQQGDYSAAQRGERREDEADLGGDMAEGVMGGDVGPAVRHQAVARIGYAKATKLGGEDVEGKLPKRYGLQVAPTFEHAIRIKPNNVLLHLLKATEFWNSPA